MTAAIAFEWVEDGRTIAVVAQIGRLAAWKAPGAAGVAETREAAVGACQAALRAYHNSNKRGQA